MWRRADIGTIRAVVGMGRVVRRAMANREIGDGIPTRVIGVPAVGALISAIHARAIGILDLHPARTLPPVRTRD